VRKFGLYRYTEALLELVEPSSKNIEIAVVTKEGTATMSSDDVDTLIKAIEAEKEAADKAKKDKAKKQADDAQAAAAGN
jgi:20S proteasome subunit alpha 4